MAITFKKNRCKGCGYKLRKDRPLAEVRIGTAEGTLVMEVCQDCADFIDQSANIMRKSSDDRGTKQADYRDDADEDFGDDNWP